MLLENLDRRIQLDASQRVADSLGANLGNEGIGTVGLSGLPVLMLAEQLELLEGSVARIDDHVVLVVDHPL